METNGNSKNKYKYNTGLSSVQRIEYLLSNIMLHRHQRDIINLQRYLRSLYLEMETLMSDPQKEKANKLFTKIRKHQTEYTKTPTNYRNIRIDNIDDSCEQLEIYLRSILNELGILMPLEASGDENYG